MSLSEKILSTTLEQLNEKDVLIVSELFHLGRNLMEVMSILHAYMEKNIKVHTIKEKYGLGNNISSKVLAFALSISIEIERQLISQRIKRGSCQKKERG